MSKTTKRSGGIPEAAGGSKSVSGVENPMTTQESLRKERNFLSGILEASPAGILGSDRDGKILFANAAAEKILGMNRKALAKWNFFSPLGTVTDFDGRPASDQKALFDEMVRTSTPLKGIRRAVRMPDGRVFYFTLNAAPLPDESGACGGFALVFEDVTREVEADRVRRESERRYQLITNSISDGVVVLDRESRVVYVSPRWLAISEYSEEEAIGRPFPEVGGIPEEYVPVMLERFERAAEGETISLYDMAIQTKSGRRIPIEVNMSDYRDMEGRVIGRIGVFRDISERKRADEVLKSALREKEVLLREIHHRVKNNMQVISSLINLQAARLEDPRAREMLRESQRRIRTMALIHEKLYQSTDLNRINFSEYVRSLCVHLFHGFQVDPTKIRLNLDLEDISLDVSSSIPCGLIVNELVSNSLKHAFPDGREGEIAVHFHRTDGEGLELRVSDDGVGFPPDLDFRNTGTLGMQIVTMLAEQIDGTISREGGRGTSFRISFAPSS